MSLIGCCSMIRELACGNHHHPSQSDFGTLYSECIAILTKIECIDTSVQVMLCSLKFVFVNSRQAPCPGH